MIKLIWVGLGGACGAAGRYLISLIPIKSAFPFLTLMTNVMGALLIGFVIGAAANTEQPSENLILFLRVGICGGFTTFSAFSAESLFLLENGNMPAGILYIFLSVSLCIFGVWLGRNAASLILGK